MTRRSPKVDLALLWCSGVALGAALVWLVVR